MTTIKTTKKANKLVKVERWIGRHLSKIDDWDGILAEQLDNGKWMCEIEIPEANVTVKAVSNTEANAMLKAADKAYEIIKAYLYNDPDDNKTINNIRNWVMEIGENGEFISLRLSKEQCAREGKQWLDMTKKSFGAIERAIDRIGRIYGSTQNLIIEIVDRKGFPQCMDDNEVHDEIYKRLTKQYGNFITGSSVIRENLVIYVGYIFRGKGA